MVMELLSGPSLREEIDLDGADGAGRGVAVLDAGGRRRCSSPTTAASPTAT